MLNQKDFSETTLANDGLSLEVAQLSLFITTWPDIYALGNFSAHLRVRGLNFHIIAAGHTTLWLSHHASSSSTWRLSVRGTLWVLVLLGHSELHIWDDFPRLLDIFLRSMIFFKLVWNTKNWQIFAINHPAGVLNSLKNGFSIIGLEHVIILVPDVDNELNVATLRRLGNTINTG